MYIVYLDERCFVAAEFTLCRLLHYFYGVLSKSFGTCRLSALEHTTVYDPFIGRTRQLT